MPEISEVKLTAEFVTQANKNRTIENVSFCVYQPDLLESPLKRPSPFNFEQLAGTGVFFSKTYRRVLKVYHLA